MRSSETARALSIGLLDFPSSLAIPMAGADSPFFVDGRRAKNPNRGGTYTKQSALSSPKADFPGACRLRNGILSELPEIPGIGDSFGYGLAVDIASGYPGVHAVRGWP
ncbi:hypothetical protein EHS39_07465 [Ensifer sp. MPMI2T]|nr:hypothetical protein EHS39_07465 [Ensifer sp. MPMI2T]